MTSASSTACVLCTCCVCHLSTLCHLSMLCHLTMLCHHLIMLCHLIALWHLPQNVVPPHHAVPPYHAVPPDHAVPFIMLCHLTMLCYLTMPCHCCRAQARLAASQTAIAKTGTDAATLRVTLSHKQGVLQAAKQQHSDRWQQAEMQRLSLGSLMLHQTLAGDHNT